MPRSQLSTARPSPSHSASFSAAEHDPDHLATLYTPGSDSNISDVGSAFRDASTVFRTRMPNLGAKRIFLVTDNDDPAKGQPEQLKAALNNRRDLLDLGYDLDPFFVPPTQDGTFELDKFYTVGVPAAVLRTGGC